jgi:hypothetical protein
VCTRALRAGALAGRADQQDGGVPSRRPPGGHHAADRGRSSGTSDAVASRAAHGRPRGRAAPDRRDGTGRPVRRVPAGDLVTRSVSTTGWHELIRPDTDEWRHRGGAGRGAEERTGETPHDVRLPTPNPRSPASGDRAPVIIPSRCAEPSTRPRGSAPLSDRWRRSPEVGSKQMPDDVILANYGLAMVG